MSKHIRPHCPSLSILSLHSVTSTSLSRERKKKRGWLHFRDWDYPSYDRGPALDQLHHHVRLVAKKVVRGKSGSSMEEKQSGQCKCLLIKTLYNFSIFHHGNYKNAYLSAPITMRTVKTLKNCVWFIGRRMAWNEMGSVYQQSKHVLWMIFGSNTLEDVEGFCATNIIFWMRILSDEENGRGGGGGKGREGVVTESGSSHWYFDGAGQLVANSQS